MQQEDSSSQGASNPHACVTLGVAVLPFDATNGHGHLTKNLTISRRREGRGMAISDVSSRLEGRQRCLGWPALV